MLLLRSLNLYETRSPQELLKASGLTQARHIKKESSALLHKDQKQQETVYLHFRAQVSFMN